MDTGSVPDDLGKTGVPEGLPEPPGGTNGPSWALVEREEGPQRASRVPPLGSLNWTRGKGGGAPLSLSLPSSPFHVGRNFFEILRSPKVVSEPGLCVDVICKIRIQ